MPRGIAAAQLHGALIDARPQLFAYALSVAFISETWPSQYSDCALIRPKFDAGPG